MKIQVLLPTAGMGARMKMSCPKPLIDLCGKPVIVRTLEAFECSPSVESVILIAPADYLKDFEAVISRAGLKKVCALVEGGETRTQSVRNGLVRLDKDTDIVLIHDGVRPLVTEDIIARGIALVLKEMAVAAAVPVKPTIKVADPRTHEVTETLDRELLWEIQTPQIFDRLLLERAYREDREGATDDAALVEKLGVKVKLFLGDYRNIKITTPEDLIIAEAFLKNAGSVVNSQ